MYLSAQATCMTGCVYYANSKLTAPSGCSKTVPKVLIRLYVVCLLVHGEGLQGKTHPSLCSLFPGKLKRVPAGEDFYVPVNSVFWCTVKRIPGEDLSSCSLCLSPGTKVPGEGLFLFVFMLFISCCSLRGSMGRHVNVVCLLYAWGYVHKQWRLT